MVIITVLQYDSMLWLVSGAFGCFQYCMYLEKKKLLILLIFSLWPISCECLPVLLALWVWNQVLWAEMTQRKFEKILIILILTPSALHHTSISYTDNSCLCRLDIRHFECGQEETITEAQVKNNGKSNSLGVELTDIW